MLENKNVFELFKGGKKAYKAAAVAMVLLLLSTVAVFGTILGNSNEEWEFIQDGADIYFSKEESTDDTIKETKKNVFPVYIVGEVKEPGIYHITQGAFLYEIVDMAGGFTENAAAESINLVFEITANQTIRIPSKEDIVDSNTDDFYEKILIIDESIQPSDEMKMININSASLSQLETLPGIGQVTAASIIRYREENGPFGKIEDIMNVSGIKDSRFAAIRDYITVEK